MRLRELRPRRVFVHGVRYEGTYPFDGHRVIRSTRGEIDPLISTPGLIIDPETSLAGLPSEHPWKLKDQTLYFLPNLILKRKGTVTQTSKAPGTAPGALIFVGEKKTERIRMRSFHWTKEKWEEEEYASIAELTGRIDRHGTWWINIDGLHDVALLETIGSALGIHPLVLEDILNTKQRPKVENYDDYLFAVTKILEYDPESTTVSQEQVSLILTSNIVLSFQERPGTIFEILRDRIRNNDSRIRRKGADYFFYRLLDTIVDRYFGMLEGFGETLELLEEDLMERPTRELLWRIQSQKREMMSLRRSVWPIREMISTLQRDETKLISVSTRKYLRDLYDHSIQVLDTIEGFRDTVSGMLDIYLSSASNRMNEVMKTLTIMASIFIPLTFVAGIYGMNFNPEAGELNMPELNWVFGYPFALTLMGLIAMIMVIFFKKRNWI